MSGKGSRERRVEATRRARADVYASNGDTVSAIPYPDDERMQRIYESSYSSWRNHYWRMEGMVDEMYQVYGGERPMRPNA